MRVNIHSTAGLTILFLPLLFLASCCGDPGLGGEETSALFTVAPQPEVKEIASLPNPEGEKLYKTKTCFTCHGIDGLNPILPDYPVLAGQNAAYALQQMKDIASGDRANGMSIAMKGIMHLVTEEEMATLADYIETGLSPAEASTQIPENATGEKLFRSRTCFTCHGADAKSPILPDYPIIAGHSPEYALQQMKDIKSGARSNGMSAGMKGIMHLVNEEEMQILADYISTLSR